MHFDDPDDVARGDRMAAAVEEMLRLEKEHTKAEALKKGRRYDLARRIERLDAKADALMRRLHGLIDLVDTNIHGGLQ